MRACWILVVGLAAGGCERFFSLDPVGYDAPVDAPPCEPRSVATGRSHTCAIDSLGKVYCWGADDYAQAQAGGDFVLVPAAITLPAPAVQVAAGKANTCARLEDGAIWCWGANDDGQLGAGGTTTSTAPAKVIGIPVSAEIAVAGYHVCSRSADDGAVWCWGRNAYSEAGGTGDDGCEGSDPCLKPHLVSGTVGSKRIALGHRHSCVIDAEDRVACWGRNDNSQLGDSTPSHPDPVRIPQLGTVIDVDAGGKTSCAIETGGALKCWGAGYDGQLGTGAYDDATAPVSTLVEGVRELALGAMGGCAIRTDNSVTCWGDHDGGEGIHISSSMPRDSLATDVVHLTSGFFHSCAIAHGGVECWGADDDAQLGRGSRAISTTPVVVPLPVSGFSSVSTGDAHACGIAAGKTYCWGENGHGETLGPALVERVDPIEVPTSISFVVGVQARWEHTCVWGGNVAQCWGRAYSGVLGNNTSDRVVPLPTTVTQADGAIESIALGRDHMCALEAGAKVECFGYNKYGQAGKDPADSTVEAGTIVAGLTTPTAVSAGANHTCAVDGQAVRCWGRNDVGQLGDGTKIDRFTPMPVSGTGIVVAVSTGDGFTCILNAAGEVYCWGDGGGGQLGNGTNVDASTPQKVLLPVTVDLITVGRASACARGKTGTVYCWGKGGVGQLGTGATNDVSVPVAVPGYELAASLSVGNFGSCAVNEAGQVLCSGKAALLGNGDNSRAVPTPVSFGSCQ